jgi:hypothetical protein
MSDVEHIADWSELEGIEWPNVLFGNGLSRAFSDNFRYDSIYERASRDTLEHPLSDLDRAIFVALDTTNFETVLSALATTILVQEAYALDNSLVQVQYESIRNALVEAVRDLHPDQGRYVNMLSRLQESMGSILECLHHQLRPTALLGAHA